MHSKRVNSIAKPQRPSGISTVSFPFARPHIAAYTTLTEITLGIYATSRHIPGVRFAGIIHPGLVGTAPSAELLATWNEREGALIEAHGVSVPPVAYPPEPIGAYIGQDLDEELYRKIAREGARTIPGRENGGNCDVSSPVIISVLIPRP